MNDGTSSSSDPGRRAADFTRPVAGQNPLDWAREIGAADRVVADLDRYLGRQRQRQRQFAGVAAMVVLGVAAVWWQPWRTAAPTVPVAADSRAVVLEPEKRGLPDGTVVELTPGAAIEVLFSDALRRVVLRGGAAHFTVIKDAARPFVVAASGLEACAVGTAFLVDPAASGLAVVVTEGRVALARGRAVEGAAAGTEPAAPLAIISAGEGVRFGSGATGSGAVAIVPAAEIPRLLAWRVPRLEFADAPLAWVVRMFNTHGGARIVLEDESVAAGRVSGVLRADDPESLFRLLEVEFGLKAERRDGVWHLRRG